MGVPRSEKGYEKYAWIILLAIGIFWSLQGITYQKDSVYVTTDFAAWVLRTLFLGMGIFGVAITLRPYRGGERWAWYALSYWPIMFVIHRVTFGLYPIDGPFAFASFLGLALPVRKFFPKATKVGIIGLGIIGLAIIGMIVIGTIFRLGIPIYCGHPSPTVC